MGKKRGAQSLEGIREQFNPLLEKLLDQVEALCDQSLKSLPKTPSVLAKAERNKCTYVLMRFPTQAHKQLTERQREVALLAGEGLRNNQIAERLDKISKATVAAHLRIVFGKLDVKTRTELARYSILLG